MNLKRLGIYTKQVKMMIQDVLIYRVDILTRIVSHGSRFLLAAFLWYTIFTSNGGNIAGYDTSQTLTYFLLIQVIGGFVFVHSGFRISSDIQYGDLSNKLILPMDYLMMAMSRELGNTLFYFTVQILLYSGIALIFKDLFALNFAPGMAALGLGFMLISFWINYCINMMVGMLAFWLTTATRLMYTYFAIVNLIGGMLIPMEFFPLLMQKILFWTPFPYLFYFPVKLIQSPELTPELMQQMGTALGYSILTGCAMYLMYKRGLKLFEAVGR